MQQIKIDNVQKHCENKKYQMIFLRSDIMLKNIETKLTLKSIITTGTNINYHIINQTLSRIKWNCKEVDINKKCRDITEKIETIWMKLYR